MGKVLMVGGGGGGTSSDDLTATKADVIKGLTAVTRDSDDEPIAGTIEDYAAGTAVDSVASATGGIAVRLKPGAYRQNGKSGKPEVHAPYGTEFNTAIGMAADKILKGTTIAGQAGTLEVQSIVNFNLSLYSSLTILGAWQNPTKGPYSGVVVMAKQGSHPTSVSDGTKVYEGPGTSFTKALAAGTWYFTAWSYMTTSQGRIYSDETSKGSYNIRSVAGSQTLTSTGTWTVPEGVRSVTVFVVGGGGGGNGPKSSGSTGNGGGGSGRVGTGTYSVTPGQKIPYTIGSGGAGGGTDGNGLKGGTTSFGSFISALPGNLSVHDNVSHAVGNGGSGGGNGGSSSNYSQGFRGGSNGSGGRYSGSSDLNNSMRVTTRAFGRSNGTLYAGGAGGGGSSYGGANSGGAGGDGGGGRGGSGDSKTYGGSPGVAGTANTGSGGGGAGAYAQVNGGKGGNGGSGLILLEWK